MRAAVFLAWCAGWWSLPAACLLLGGRLANFVGLLGLVALTTTLAGYFYLWPTEAWLRAEREDAERRARWTR